MNEQNFIARWEAQTRREERAWAEALREDRHHHRMVGLVAGVGVLAAVAVLGVASAIFPPGLGGTDEVAAAAGSGCMREVSSVTSPTGDQYGDTLEHLQAALGC